MNVSRATQARPQYLRLPHLFWATLSLILNIFGDCV
jgi:hypothetical protein